MIMYHGISIPISEASDMWRNYGVGKSNCSPLRQPRNPRGGARHLDGNKTQHGPRSPSLKKMPSAPPLKGLKTIELGGLAPVPFVGYPAHITTQF
jgi:hypothetical protein